MQKYDLSNFRIYLPHLVIVCGVVAGLFAAALIILACWDWFWSPMFGLPGMDMQEAIGAVLSIGVVVGIGLAFKEVK